MNTIKRLIITYFPGPIKVFLMKTYGLAKQVVIGDYYFEQSKRELIVFLPTIDRTYMPQRVHQLAKALSREYDVVFLSYRKKTDRFSGLFYEKGVWVCSSIFLVQKIISDHRYDKVVFRTTEIENLFLLRWIKGLPYRAIKKGEKFTHPTFKLIYDVVDNLKVQAYYHKALEFKHQKVIKSANIVVASAQTLYDEIPVPHKILFKNGVNYTDWQVNYPVPEDISHLVQSQKPIIGFYGAIFEHIDYALLKQVITRTPEYQYLFIGPIMDKRFMEIKKLSTVTWLDKKPYDQLPRYWRYIDVSLWPFVINEITNNVSPVKLFEYLAAGTPVVATKMVEAEINQEFLLLADNVEEFVSQIARGISLKKDSGYVSKIQQKARENDRSSINKVITKALS